MSGRVARSTNTSMIIGSGNVVNQSYRTPQPVEVLPYSDTDYGLLAAGKWIMRRLFGTLNHHMKVYAVVTSVLTVITGLPFVLPFIPSLHIQSSLSLFSMADAVALALVLYLGWGVVLWSVRTRCPRCGERFRFKVTNRTLVGRVRLPEKEVRNYVNTKSCDNPECGYKEENVPETVEISNA